MGKYSWELTEDQKKEFDEKTRKVVENWNKKNGASDAEDAEAGDNRQERERTKEDDGPIR